MEQDEKNHPVAALAGSRNSSLRERAAEEARQEGDSEITPISIRPSLHGPWEVDPGVQMKIEAVIVCKDYADFLEHSLPENLQHLDRAVVVTHPDDKKTQQLCAKFGVDCQETTVFHDDGDKFNKGRAINLGLSHLRNDGWLLHLDADIVLPHRFRPMLAHAKLNPKHLYGADRLNTRSYEHWMEHKHKAVPQHAWRYLVSPPKEFQMGSRLLHEEYGYCPIGYFQLWNSSVRRRYPVINGSAEHGDVMFAVQWPRAERILLPELFVFHLESDENAAFGANWNGRKTRPFGPRHHGCDGWEVKHHHHHPHPYCPKKGDKRD